MRNPTDPQIAPVKSVARALMILETIADHPQGLVLTDIGRMLDIPLSSLHDLVQTLTQYGYLMRPEGSMKYHLGSKVALFASAYFANTDLISLADPLMAEITRTTGETTSLSMLEGPDVLFIHKHIGTGIIQVVNPVGTRHPAYATGSGKCMLAHLPDAIIDQLYPQAALRMLTPNTISTLKQLKRQLAVVADLGYAIDNEESVTGVWAVASAIRNHEGFPVGALSIVGPTARLRVKDTSGWSELVQGAVSKVSRTLGFSDWAEP